MAKTQELLTLGEVATRLGCHPWHIERLFERKLLPAPMRVGRIRVVPIGELPAVRKAAEEAGYLAK